jgi:hypothetical protein
VTIDPALVAPRTTGNLPLGVKHPDQRNWSHDHRRGRRQANHLCVRVSLAHAAEDPGIDSDIAERRDVLAQRDFVV